MKKFSRITFIFCGLLIQLAAFPVFGQNENEPPKEVELNKKPFIELGKAVREKFEKDKDETVREIQINKKPINDLAQYLLAKVERDKTDLSQPFKVVLEGTLIKKTGNDFDIVVLENNKSKWIGLTTEESGDPKMVEIAKNAVLAISDSGFLGHFYNLEIKDLKITFYQNADKFVVNLESEMETIERARTVASGLSALSQIAKMTVKSEDEKFLLNGFQTPSTKEKVLLLNFELPKNTVHEIINRNLTNYKNRKLSEQK